ncbi:hypothetical protein L218DRAFT_1001812 [Marasmius fiardii PR-910]|nr:hypothetical protein L218DRAFT_1001812 [Marasmius fiardii PR-910]
MPLDENVADTQAPVQGMTTVQQSWETIQKKVDRVDEDRAQGYKEDIDTLLVFAGLFSAVVTAFTIESYKWLQEDPSDTTVALLTELVQQGRHEPPSSPEKFIASSSVVRINTFWFLSLALALVDALFGLLCKQWVREHQRQTNTRTPQQALALRWLRYQSFERWHVPAILASLPILLEIALFLFLAGLLELLFVRHPIPFAFSLAVVGLAGVFYIMTTILPGVSIIHQALRVHPYFSTATNPSFDPLDLPRLPEVAYICPYKSPQSWLMFKLISSMYHLPWCRWFLHLSITTFNQNWKGESNHITSLDHTVDRDILDLSEWAELDLNIVQRFSRIEGCPDLYVFKGFRWLVRETSDNPSMVPHLKNVLGELPLHLAMFTIFDKWVPDEKPVWTVRDVESMLERPHPSEDDIFGDQWPTKNLALTSRILCFRNLVATYDEGLAEVDERGDRLSDAAEEIWRRIEGLKEPVKKNFVWAFFRPEELLIGSNRAWRRKVLEFYLRHWDELEEASHRRLVERLAGAVILFMDSEAGQTTVRSTVLGSTYGGEFFRLVNGKINPSESPGIRCRESPVNRRWRDAFTHVQHVQHEQHGQHPQYPQHLQHLQHLQHPQSTKSLRDSGVDMEGSQRSEHWGASEENEDKESQGPSRLPVVNKYENIGGNGADKEV